MKSQPSKDLACYFNTLRIKPHGESNYRYRDGDIIVNYGGSTPRSFPIHINQTEAVQKAINKLWAWDTFNHGRVPTVCYTDDRGIAEEWLESGVPVYARETLHGFGGTGIRVFLNREDLDRYEPNNSTTFTKGFPTHREFRVLVVGSKAVQVSEKMKRRGTTPNPFIRNHAGWVFVRNDLRPYPETIKEDSIKAVQCLGLDFGGVDIAIDSSNNTCVFEVNTAPGLSGSAVSKLGDAIKQLVGSRGL